ncbi:hypothetical protein CLOM_g7848 [Closterium sp. NIES-68]|nr:hypothetical protein CLOM_g7848 [Closterium sp. NIES-68]
MEPSTHGVHIGVSISSICARRLSAGVPHNRRPCRGHEWIGVGAQGAQDAHAVALQRLHVRPAAAERPAGVPQAGRGGAASPHQPLHLLLWQGSGARRPPGAHSGAGARRRQPGRGAAAAALRPLRLAGRHLPGNRLLYDPTWGGVVSEAGSRDKGADFGLGMYNDHHFHYGYFVYAAAAVAKFDPVWGSRYRSKLSALVADYMSVNRTAAFPRLRNFDAYALHSWASGLFDFGDGRNQESFSEAANAYYAGSLLAYVFGDLPLATLGATLAAVEAVAAQTLMQVPASSSSPPSSLSPAYEPVFADTNRMVGVLWSTKRDAALWFAPPADLDKRVGIQVLPITPFLAHLFPDRSFARQLVEWAQPVLSGGAVTDEWRGFSWALQALYDPEGARAKIAALGAFDDGNSKTNMLWWLATNTP